MDQQKSQRPQDSSNAPDQPGGQPAGVEGETWAPDPQTWTNQAQSWASQRQPDPQPWAPQAQAWGPQPQTFQPPQPEQSAAWPQSVASPDPGATPAVPGADPNWTQPYPAYYQAWPAANNWQPQPAAPKSTQRRIGGLVLGTALLSALLSAGGTYVAFSVAPRQAAAPAQAGSTNAAGVTVVSLTQSDAIVRVFDAVKPSVVTISTTGTQSVGRRSAQFTGSGSGFIVNADGLIVTNNHVVMDAQSMTVTLDGGRELPAKIVKTDPNRDLALIKIDASGLKPVTLGDSSAIQVGQLAIAIGSPLGEFTESVTSGIVSGLNRSITVGESGSNFSEDLSGLIQTDAAINPGNSGGPLLDASGNVIGVVTAASSSAQDMGFAVPVSEVRNLIQSAGQSI